MDGKKKKLVVKLFDSARKIAGVAEVKLEGVAIGDCLDKLRTRVTVIECLSKEAAQYASGKP